MLTVMPSNTTQKNDMTDYEEKASIVILILVFVLLMSNLAWGINYKHLKAQAIEHGAAEYNKTTGKWQWIEDNGQEKGR